MPCASGGEKFCPGGLRFSRKEGSFVRPPGRGAEECGAAGRRKVQDLKKIVVFTGAGVSADSGLATFRDADGLWADYRIEEVCTPEALARSRGGDAERR